MSDRYGRIRDNMPTLQEWALPFEQRWDDLRPEDYDSRIFLACRWMEEHFASPVARWLLRHGF